MISSAQCRAARGLLDWTQDDLARNAQVARATVAAFERADRIRPMRQNLISIVAALEAAGVAFIADEKNGQGAGVRFRELRLEYSRTVRPDDKDIVVSVNYLGNPLAVVVPRIILDDFAARIFADLTTPADRALLVQNRLPLILRAAERKCERGEISPDGRIMLTHGDFPEGTF
jgi:transcriptional regulator with XRE-family HTH domain